MTSLIKTARTFILSTAVIGALATPAVAALPDNVMEAYRAYNSAVQAQDYARALKEGRKAWQRAEKALGDNKTTGDLAFNYGYLEKARGDAKKAVPALKRAAELATLGRDSGEVRMEREVELVSALERAGETKAVTNQVARAMDFARSNGLSRSVFAGELYLHDASACNARAARAANQSARNRTGSRLESQTNLEDYTAAIQAQCAKSAETALSVFNENPTKARGEYVASAANLVGFAKERSGDYLGAALSYQQARAAVEAKLGRNDPLVRQTIGRWVNARARLKFDGKLEAAMASGMMDMWPYKLDTPKAAIQSTGPDSQKTQTINTNQGSGYAVLQVDVDDAGMPRNIRVVDSWPGDGYVRESKRALEAYRFAPKTGSEPEGYRKDITVPFTYTIFDRESNKAY